MYPMANLILMMTRSQNIVECRCLKLLFCLANVVSCPACLPMPTATDDHAKAFISKLKSAARSTADWIVDSGATVHCVSDINLMSSIYTDHKPVKVVVANKQTITSHAVGTAVIAATDTHGRTHQIVLHNVIYHPSFHVNLISVSRLWHDNRIKTRFGGSNYLYCVHAHAKFKLDHQSLYQLSAQAAACAVTANDLDLLHARFGHCSYRRLSKIPSRAHNFPANVKHDPARTTHDCDSCNAGATRKRAFARRSSVEYTYFGERLSSDLCGPFPKSIDGHRYLPEHERDSKISPRAVPAIHLGCDTLRRGYLVYVPYLNRITSAYHLIFQERKFAQFDDEGIAFLPDNVKSMRGTQHTRHELSDKSARVLPPDPSSSDAATPDDAQDFHSRELPTSIMRSACSFR